MFSLTTEYALRAMAWLALHPDTLVATTDLAEKTKVPPTYLAKVLQQLSNAGLITGRRGVGGGYKLAKRAEEMRLLDIVRAVDRIERITSCPLGIPSHGAQLCPLHKRADQAAAAIIEIYNGTTLQDLLDERGGSKPLCESRPTDVTISARR